MLDYAKMIICIIFGFLMAVATLPADPFKICKEAKVKNIELVSCKELNK